jgi:hypothetical protein
MAKSKASIAAPFSFVGHVEQSRWFLGAAALLIPILSKAERIRVTEFQKTLLENEYIDLLFVFTLAFTTTRDLLISLMLTVLFYIMMNHILHTDSPYSLLSQKRLKETKSGVSNAQIGAALDVLEKAHQERQVQQFIKPNLTARTWFDNKY